MNVGIRPVSISIIEVIVVTVEHVPWQTLIYGEAVVESTLTEAWAIVSSYGGMILTVVATSCSAGGSHSKRLHSHVASVIVTVNGMTRAVTPG